MTMQDPPPPEKAPSEAEQPDLTPLGDHGGMRFTQEEIDEAPVASIPEPPELRPTPMTELQWVGAQLAGRVLSMMGWIIGVLLIMIAVSEFGHPTPEISSMQRVTEKALSPESAASMPEAVARTSEALARVNEARRESRAFWINIGQFLLLNLLLPVLTSILGYIFGTMRAEQKARNDC